jgi:penicillin-binding protein 2
MFRKRSQQQKAISRSKEIDDSLLTLTKGEISKLDASFNRRYMKYAWLLVVLLISILGVRVIYLTVVQGDYYTEIAQGNSIRSFIVTAPRGNMYDRSGRVLVHNIPSTDVVLDNLSITKNHDERKYLAWQLSSILDISQEDIFQAFQELEESLQNRIILKRAISQEEALQILEKERDLAGVILEHTVQRLYEDSTIFSHIIGYESKVSAQDLEDHPEYYLTDSIGRQGIEKTFEKYLRGTHGEKRAEVDSLGKIKRFIATNNPVSGDDLVLTIHSELQKKLYDSIESELMKSELTKAAAVALDPRNGEILALVSFPSYDNNIFSAGSDREKYQMMLSDPDRPLFNRVVSGEYPPGSTIKPVVAAAALQEGIVSDQKQIESKGGIQVGSFFFGDWKVHGYTDIRRAIAVSSDVYFYAIGGGYGDVKGLGMDTMKEYENLFGYGVPTGIDLPSEADGFIPSVQWKEETLDEPWYIGNSYHASIGQGYITATPLQVAVSISAIANYGTLYEPKIVSLVQPEEGEVMAQKERIKRTNILPKRLLQVVREGMRETVTDGTALALNDMQVEIAGKTGTAQYGVEDKTHGWFVSFAPYEDPEIVLAVLVESQGEDGYHAVPITEQVYRWYFDEEENTLSESKNNDE